MLYQIRDPHNHLIGEISGAARLWCRRCKKMYNVGIVPLSTGFEIKVVECQRVPNLEFGTQNED